MAMSAALHTVTTLPTARQPGCPFDPPAALIDARRHGPISRYPFPGGKPGWLITGYDLVRSVLADSRFSSRKELMRHPSIDMTGMAVPAAPPGEFLLMDEPQHRRYRKPLVGRFTVRRMRLLTDRVGHPWRSVRKLAPGSCRLADPPPLLGSNGWRHRRIGVYDLVEERLKRRENLSSRLLTAPAVLAPRWSASSMRRCWTSWRPIGCCGAASCGGVDVGGRR
jgi:hypothetical protein